MTKAEWWRNAIIYQVYPRSFKDSNGDGIGDLPGVTEKLDYIAGLGVDAVWLSPFFKSPMKDYGYDVADYRDVDPMFGTLDDFRVLVDEAHKRDLKIIIDLVLSHTSDQHEWFQESRQSRDNEKADWYVWADPKPDGSPPSNWQAHFGGPSWTFDIRRGQYYMHNFLSSQPDLNFHCEAVQEELLDMTRFWLEFGVDGFRLDAAAHYFHQESLKDNPPNDDPAPAFFNINFPTPFSMQHHIYDKDLDKTFAFMERFRALLDEYDGRMSVGEMGGEDGIAQSAAVSNGGKRLHTCYTFSMLGRGPLMADTIRKPIEEFLAQPGDGWPSWAFSNHDVVRVASRWHKEAATPGQSPHDPRLSKMLIALLGTLYGTLFLYQGEELGLPEAQVDYDLIQDPWGRFLYPLWQGRDGCRTPIPWDQNQAWAGFCAKDVEPWLPVDPQHHALSVTQQNSQKNSVLAFTKAFITARKTVSLWREQPEISFVETDDPLALAYILKTEKARLVCVFNLSDEERKVKLPGLSSLPASDVLPVPDGQQGRFTAADDEGAGYVTLPPYGLLFAR